MSRVRLGELLLTRGICTRAQLSQAWEQKVVYGDRLGTNLLALGFIDEVALALALGVQHGVHAGYAGVLQVDPAAVEKVAKSLAVKRNVVPHHIVDRTLFLLMKDPDDLQAIDDVRFATQFKVQPVAVCEARLWRLLFEHYGQKSPLRPNPIDSIARPHAPTLAVAKPKAPVEDLVSEAEFQLLYARLAAGGLGEATLPTAPESETAAPPFLAKSKTSEGTEAPIPQTAAAAPPTPLASVQADPHKAARAAFAEIDLLDVADEMDDVMGVADPVTLPPADLSPLSFADAAALLTAAQGRDDIARVVLRAARAHFARACLLTVYPHAFVGWQGVGAGFETETLIDITLPRNVPSVFALVADSRAHYLGPLQRFSAHGAWVKATGKKIPKTLAVLPILVRGRVVNVLVVDNGHEQHAGSELGDLLILSQHIAGTYEQLIERG